jgi:DNA-binding transcriptional regulator YiaG
MPHSLNRRNNIPALITVMPPEPDDIRAARTAAGLTQTEAGDLVHASLRTWQQWEAGDRKMHPGLFELFRLKTRQEKRKQQANDRNQA